MAEPGGQTRKNVNGASTMETLLRFGIEEFHRNGSINFNLETVLRESGVSRGSLYHHFGSRHGLISHCEAQVLRQSLKSDNEGIRRLIEDGTSGETLFEVLSMVIRNLGTPDGKDQRSRRVRTIATSMEDPSLRSMIGESQVRGSQFLIESFQLAVDKGLIKPRVDLPALVYLLQSMFIGRVLVDITDDENLSSSVSEATISTLRYLLNPLN